MPKKTEKEVAKEERAGFETLGVFVKGKLVREYHSKDYGPGSANPSKRCDEDAESFAKKFGGKVEKLR